jgi:tRNA threonylcarbamoyl adenosine modification protein (Sua5/YciO/YrdC/YwlC family)
MAEFIKLYKSNNNPKTLDHIVSVLKQGGLIIYPTDTVYGLGCDFTNLKALQRIANIKGVKLDKSNFSFICSDLSNLSDYAKQLNSSEFKLLKRALPGPYTFILKSSKSLPHYFKKKKTVGIRVPDHPIAVSIVDLLGNPIISTSIHDEDDVIEYTTDPELIYEKWSGLVDIVIDAGFGGNEPSTVIDLSKDEIQIIREGKGNIDIV